MQGLIMQFMDFPGRFVLSHQLPGALQKKVLAKDGLVLSLKGGFLPNLNWVFPGGGGGVLGHCMLAHKHLLGAPKRNPTLPAPHHQSPDSLSRPLLTSPSSSKLLDSWEFPEERACLAKAASSRRWVALLHKAAHGSA